MSWKEAALAHAKKSSKEVCGLVCLVDGVETYIACKNVSEEPEQEFLICPDSWIKAEDQGEPVAVFHSHPGQGVLPNASETDIESCNHVDLPFYIVNPESESWDCIKPSS